MRVPASRDLGTAVLGEAQTRTRSPSDAHDPVWRVAPHANHDTPRIEARVELSPQVIHRDLKPENLLLAREPHSAFPTVKIIDFGLSKARATRDVCASFLGTRGYLAPEMVLNRRPRAFEPARHRRRRRVDCVGIAARRRVSRASQAADVLGSRGHVGLRGHRLRAALRLPALRRRRGAHQFSERFEEIRAAVPVVGARPVEGRAGFAC